MPNLKRNSLLFMLFFFSGFCGLIYQVVWLRMAFANFGVISQVLSVVISVFMLGLCLGSEYGGKWVLKITRSLRISPIYLYATAEFVTGIGAFLVPIFFDGGERSLLHIGSMTSNGYLALSGVFITLAILPWCIMMGTTFPFMLAFVKETEPENEKMFSFLYLANVIGAMVGAVSAALVWIEVLGLHGTCWMAAFFNFSIAITAVVIGRKASAQNSQPQEPTRAPSEVRLVQLPRLRWMEVILFTTGFTSMAMEVVWTRGFTFVLRTKIYSFALLLSTYLCATWIGSYFYRRHLRQGRVLSTEALLAWLCPFAFLPVILDDPRVQASMVIVLISIVPFCATLGYLTPKLIDQYSSGDPARMGRSYAFNILGSIIGPLLAGYYLLPVLGVRTSLILLAFPFIGLFLAYGIRSLTLSRTFKTAIITSSLALLVVSITVSRTYEDGQFYSGPHELHRDNVASVMATGTGMDKNLFVNGIDITKLTPITKVMAHLPLAVHDHAKRGLVICFGMGTTFRAMHSWGIDTTAVELSKAVADSFSFFFSDAPELLKQPNAHLVIDDGRRYLLRTSQKFDVITLDPPPPVEAAGSGLLYSKEFYQVVKSRLAPGGILQQWFPGGEQKILLAVAQSLYESFPYVVVYQSFENWGYHFLASNSPIPDITAEQFAERLPEKAKVDLLEWSPGETVMSLATKIILHRFDLKEILDRNVALYRITDDRPFNEYFMLRRTLDHLTGAYKYVGGPSTRNDLPNR